MRVPGELKINPAQRRFRRKVGRVVKQNSESVGLAVEDGVEGCSVGVGSVSARDAHEVNRLATMIECDFIIA